MSFRLFSNPGEGDFASYVERLSCRLFLSTLKVLDDRADRLGAPRILLEEGAITPARMSTRLWRPELGSVLLGFHQGLTEADWSWVSGQVRIGAYLSELEPALDVEVRGRHPLTIAGHLVRGDHLIVKGDQERLEVRSGSGDPVLELTKVALEGIAPVWVRDRGVDLVRLGSGAVATVSDGRWMNAWYPGLDPLALTSDPASSRRTLEAALQLLEQHLPAQYLWICFVLREVTLLPDMGFETTASQSFTTWPGYVQLSQSTVLQNIIMLLHECSHQYFHMLLWSGPAVKKDAPDAYSILKDTKRPLDKLLLGYHAFGNVLLALAELARLDVGLDRHELARQIDSTGHLVSDLDAELEPRCEPHLEQQGKDIYLPLRKRLAAAVKLPKPRHDRDLSMVHD